MATLTNIRIYTQSKAVPNAGYIAIDKVMMEGNTIVAMGGDVRYVLGVVPMENIVVDTPSVPEVCGCNTTNANIFATLIKGVDGITPDMSDYYQKREIESRLSGKQDVIRDLEAIRSGAAKGATALQSVPSEYVTETELQNKGYATTAQVNAKQDKITDLDAIRQGADKGATAVQPASLADYISKDDVDAELSETSTNPIQNQAVEWALSDLANAVGIFLSEKQDTISDLETIRDGAAKGATALQEHQPLKTINGESLVGEGNITIEGGGGGITVETDPIFSASAAASITDAKMAEWDNKVDAEDINNLKPLITDFSIADIMTYVNYGTGFNYHGEAITNALQNKQPIYIPYENEDGLEGYYAAYGYVDDVIYLNVLFGTSYYSIELDILGARVENIFVRNLDDFVIEGDLASVATSGSYNDLIDKPTIPSEVTESTVSGWGFTKNTGTYSKPSGGIPFDDLDEYTKERLEGALQSVEVEDDLFIGAQVTGFIGDLSGTSYALPNDVTINDQHILLSDHNVKTVNGESIVGQGNIVVKKQVSRRIVVPSSLGPNVVLIISKEISDSLSITGITTTDGYYDEYALHFKTGATLAGNATVSLPSYVKWAENSNPQLEADTLYELSVVKTNIGDTDYFKAVLTKFM